MQPVLISYILKGALRDKVFLTFFIGFLVVASLSLFLGDAAITEKNFFSIIYMGGALRLASILGLVLFVVFFIQKAKDTRNIEFFLAHPIRKEVIIISHISAFAILALICTLAMLGFLSTMVASLNMYGAFLWGLSIFFELTIMTSVAFFFSLFLNSAVSSSLACLGLYGLARLMGQILSILDHKAASSAGSYLMENTMNIISMLTPRLDLMGQTAWLIYGVDEQSHVDISFIVLHGMAYIAVITLACIIDLKNKQF